MRKQNLAFIDIETTGLDILEHEIIQIGCVITNPSLDIIDSFEIKIKPENIENADKISLKINGYKKEDWENALPLKEALRDFSKRIADCIMVAHNIAFDFSFIENAFIRSRVKNTLHYHKLDTISIAWAKFHHDNDIDRFSLREMCNRFGIINEKAHTALSDAHATYELYKKLLEL